MRIFTQIAFKGGVGKTATAVNLTAAAARAGYEALLVDFEPQASATQYVAQGLDWEHGVAHALKAPQRAEESIHQVGEGFWVMPSSDALLGMKVDFIMRANAPDGSADEASQRLDASLRRQVALKILLETEALQDRFDFCFVDTSPAIGIFTLNALRIGTLISPITVEVPSMKGLKRLRKTLMNFPGTPPQTYVLPLKYNAGYRQSKQVYEFLLENMGRIEEGGRVLPCIRQSQDVPHSYQAGKSIFDYKATSRAAEDYQHLFESLETLNGQR